MRFKAAQTKLEELENSNRNLSKVDRMDRRVDNSSYNIYQNNNNNNSNGKVTEL